VRGEEWEKRNHKIAYKHADNQKQDRGPKPDIVFLKIDDKATQEEEESGMDRQG
jgi:hypothetical protein